MGDRSYRDMGYHAPPIVGTCAICAYASELGRWSSARQFLAEMESRDEGVEVMRERWQLAADDPIMLAVREALAQELHNVRRAGEYAYYSFQMRINPHFEEVLAVDAHDTGACTSGEYG